MNKTKEILAILIRGIATYKGDVDVKEPLRRLAKEIDALFEDMYEAEFVEWCISNTVNHFRGGYVYVYEPYKVFDTVSDLYKFWKLNIQGK